MHDPFNSNFRSLHGTNTSSTIYSNQGGNVPKPPLPQPAPYQNPNMNRPSLSPSQSSASLRSPLVHDGGQRNGSMGSNKEDTLSPMTSAHSFTPFPIGAELSGPAPGQFSFPPSMSNNWNFGYLDEINESLDILNQEGGVSAQLDQLLNSFLSEENVMTNVNSKPTPAASGSPLFRIPTSSEVPIEGIHSAPPPSNRVWRKLTESRWNEIASQVDPFLTVYPF
jgi:hypothetical protein